MERLHRRHSSEIEIATPSDMQRVPRSTLRLGVSYQLEYTDYRRIVVLCDCYGVAEMISVPVGDQDRIDLDGCRIDLGMRIAGNERIDDYPLAVGFEDKTRVSVICDLHDEPPIRGSGQRHESCVIHRPRTDLRRLYMTVFASQSDLPPQSSSSRPLSAQNQQEPAFSIRHAAVSSIPDCGEEANPLDWSERPQGRYGY